MSRAALLPLVAVAALAACGDSSSPASPTPVPVEGSADARQTTTSSQMLFYDFTSVWIMRDDGTGRVPLTIAADQAFDPSWAPDGKRILFNAGRGEPNASIYIMNPDGTGVTRITTPPTGINDVRPVAFGKQVAFVRWEATNNIYRVNLDGTGLTLVAAGTNPASAPGGGALAYVSEGDIFVYDVASGTHTNITNTPALAEADPAYSPNGKRIAFVASVAGIGSTGDGVYTMNPDGTRVTRLQWSASDDYQLPKWSPDGKRIAFSRSIGASFFADIWVMNADGSAARNLTETDGVSELVTAWAR